MITGRRK